MGRPLALLTSVAAAVLGTVGLVRCSNGMPPPLGDPDAAYYAEVVVRPPVPADAGADAGDAGAVTTQDLDFEGACTSGKLPVWHFFDFQTHTPAESALDFSARSAPSVAALDTSPSVHLATVTGPDITVWTGVDVDAKLQSIGQTSKLFLRVTVLYQPALDGTPPVLAHYRQQYDCILGQ